MKTYLLACVFVIFRMASQECYAQAQSFETSTFKCDYSSSPLRSIQVEPYNGRTSKVSVLDSDGKVKESDLCARYRLDNKNVFSLICANLIQGFGTINILYNATTNNMTFGSEGTIFEDIACENPLSPARTPAGRVSKGKK